MNKSAIPWCDLSWNPIVGCLNACGVTADNPAGWCYARRIATTRLAHLCPECATFTPHLHSKRMTQPRRVSRPALIFADSMADWWSPGVDAFWVAHALKAMFDAPQHRFVVLTKRPDRLTEWDYATIPDNAWLGVSITSGADWWRWEALAKLPIAHRFISVEPLLGPGVGLEITQTTSPLEWVVLGPMSGPGAVKPEGFWQESIRGTCDLLNIPLFEKPGLPIQPPIRQMPADLARVFRKGGVEER